MASLSADGPNGRYRITFDLAGKRHTVRLGKVSKKVGEGVKLRVAALIAAWVANVGDDLHAKLAARRPNAVPSSSFSQTTGRGEPAGVSLTVAGSDRLTPAARLHTPFASPEFPA